MIGVNYIDKGDREYSCSAGCAKDEVRGAGNESPGPEKDRPGNSHSDRMHWHSVAKSVSSDAEWGQWRAQQ